MDIVSPQFPDSNATRAYPVSSACTRVSSDGRRLPDSLIVGAVINAIPVESATTFHVTGVTLSPQTVSVTISSRTASSTAEVATVTASVQSHRRNDSYDFVGGAGAPGVRGTLVLGDLQDALSKASGIMSFPIGAARFEVSVVHFSRAYVPSVSVEESGAETVVLTGNVRLVAGRNIRLTPVSGGIRIDAISGENMSACDSIPCIRRINGVEPDAEGEIILRGTECVSVTEDGAGHSLVISDSCSTPCCGCNEQEVLTEAIRRLNLQAGSIRDLAFRLSSESSSMIANLVAHLSNG